MKGSTVQVGSRGGKQKAQLQDAWSWSRLGSLYLGRTTTFVRNTKGPMRFWNGSQLSTRPLFRVSSASVKVRIGENIQWGASDAIPVSGKLCTPLHQNHFRRFILFFSSTSSSLLIFALLHLFDFISYKLVYFKNQSHKLVSSITKHILSIFPFVSSSFVSSSSSNPLLIHLFHLENISYKLITSKTKFQKLGEIYY